MNKTAEELYQEYLYLLEKEEFILALRANTTTDQAEHGQAYGFYHKMSELYRMMSLRAEDYINQFPGV